MKTECQALSLDYDKRVMTVMTSSLECTVKLILGYMRSLSASPGAGFSFKGYICVVQLEECEEL